MTKKNMLRFCGILVLCLAICLSSVACARKNGIEDSVTVGTTGTGIMDYTICITAETGTPLEDIGVYVYTDATMAELVWFAKTDAEGKLSFSDIPSDNFVAVLANAPAGYLVEEYYRLTGEQTQITLSAGLMEGDIIVGVGDITILGDRTLRKARASIAPGESEKLVFWREGQYYETEIIRPENK